MRDSKSEVIGKREPRVEVLIELGHRTPDWRQLMDRLLAPPPCKDDRLPLHFEQKDGGKGDA